jgi:uncharacterized membrane protein YdbT with pleckstrin-like domain
MSEEVLWRGQPAQIINVWKYTVALLLAAAVIVGATFLPILWVALVIPLAWGVWIYLVVRCRVYEVTSERLRLYRGVLNQRIDELELYRVKDSVIERPFWLRLFGLSTIVLDTSDRSHPVVEIEAIRNGPDLRDRLRKQVEYWRDRKRVREVDFEEGGDMEGDEGLFES